MNEENVREESDDEDTKQDILDQDIYEDHSSTDWKLDLDHIRQQQRDDARANIKTEQIKQKKLYDKKVQTNRFYFCVRNYQTKILIFNYCSEIICRPDFKEGDLFLVLDKAKEKKIKGTKDKPVYKGPFKIARVTESHLISLSNGKERKYPIHLARKYHIRGQNVSNTILSVLSLILFHILLNYRMKIYLPLHWLALHRLVPLRGEVQPQTLLRKK